MDQDRTRRALSDGRFTFFSRPPYWRKTRNTGPKDLNNSVHFRKTLSDSPTERTNGGSRQNSTSSIQWTTWFSLKTPSPSPSRIFKINISAANKFRQSILQSEFLSNVRCKGNCRIFDHGSLLRSIEKSYFSFYYKEHLLKNKNHTKENFWN